MVDQRIDEKNYKEAATLLRVLVNIPDLGEKGARLRLQLASTLLILGEHDEAMREALTVASSGALRLDQPLRCAHAALPPLPSDELYHFITREWWPEFEKRKLATPDRIKALFFLARVNLFAGDYRAAVGQIEGAKLLDQELTERECLTVLFAPNALPAVLQEETLTAHRTRGVLLSASSCHDEAAREYLKAGQIAVRANDPGSAVPILRRSLSLMSTLQAAKWQLAEALRLASHGLSSDERQSLADLVSLINEAAEVWDLAAAEALPDVSYHWAYTVRAAICQRRAQLGVGDYLQECWQGIALLEFGTLVNDRDVYRWATLSRLLLWLNLHFCAVQASMAATEIDPTNNVVVEEQVITLLNIGDIDQANPIIEAQQRSRSSPREWWDAAKGFVEFHRGNAERALELVEGWVTIQPTALWALDLRAEAHECLGDYKSASEDYALLRQRSAASTTNGDKGDKDVFWAKAALGLGEVEQAKSMALGCKRRNRPDEFDVDLVLALCALGSGQIAEADQRLRELIRSTSGNLRLNYIRNRLKITHVRQRQSEPKLDERQLRDIETEIEKAKSSLRPRTAITELLGVIQNLASQDDKSCGSMETGWPWWGAKLSLRRLYFSSDVEDSAGPVHQELVRAADRAPGICRSLATALLTG